MLTKDFNTTEIMQDHGGLQCGSVKYSLGHNSSTYHSPTHQAQCLLLLHPGGPGWQRANHTQTTGQQYQLEKPQQHQDLSPQRGPFSRALRKADSSWGCLLRFSSGTLAVPQESKPQMGRHHKPISPQKQRTAYPRAAIPASWPEMVPTILSTSLAQQAHTAL